MDKRVGWYLVELERKLRRGLPHSRALEISREVQSHIELDIANLRSEGMAEEDAVDTALQRLGKAELTARGYLETGISFQVRGRWEQVAMLSVIGAAGFGLAGIVCSMLMREYAVWLLSISLACLLVFCGASAAVRRSMLQHLVVLFIPMVALSTLVLSRYFVGPIQEEIGFHEISRAEERYAELGNEVNQYRIYLEVAEIAYTDVEQGKPFRNDGRLVTANGILTPTSFWDAANANPAKFFYFEPSVEGSRLVWHARGKRAVSILREQLFIRDNEHRVLGRFLDSSPYQNYWASFKSFAEPAIAWLFGAVAVHLVFFGIGRACSAYSSRWRAFA